MELEDSFTGTYSYTLTISAKSYKEFFSHQQQAEGHCRGLSSPADGATSEETITSSSADEEEDEWRTGNLTSMAGDAASTIKNRTNYDRSKRGSSEGLTAEFRPGGDGGDHVTRCSSARSSSAILTRLAKENTSGEVYESHNSCAHEGLRETRGCESSGVSHELRKVTDGTVDCDDANHETNCSSLLHVSRKPL